MKKIRKELQLVFVGVLLILSISFYNFRNCSGASQQMDSTIVKTTSVVKGIPLPIVLNKDNEVVKHTYYTLGYNEEHEQANWVQYLITRSMIIGSIDRESAFIEDPLVSTNSARSADYKKSGFDRGHLCPAADMKLNTKSMRETFYMSNISPQKHQFNAGIWLDLENYVRDLVDKYDSLYVVTGPVLTNGLSKIEGKYNSISIPKYFYKIIYSPKYEWMQGYLISHDTNYKTKKEIFMYRVSVDSIENLTQIDFFNGVENEDIMEVQNIDLCSK